MNKLKITTMGDNLLIGVPKASRRRFIGYSGVAFATTALIMAGCSKDSDNSPGSVALGSGYTGVLNYAYALEQLEAAFYTMVVADSAFGTTFTDATERRLLTDIRDHEIAHREFLKAALAANAIKGLTPDFSTVNFKDRASVLGTAKTFEDLGVKAYNGAAKLFTNSGAGLDYLMLAGKIVSVEARHAAWIADRITNGTFANTTDANGLDTALDPPAVLLATKPFIKDTIDASKLPTA
jgi:hypothetical protein